jgi:hypothetical protein
VWDVPGVRKTQDDGTGCTLRLKKLHTGIILVYCPLPFAGSYKWWMDLALHLRISVCILVGEHIKSSYIIFCRPKV